MKASELRKMDDKELRAKLLELRRELLRLNALSARGIIGKESGVVKGVRRDVARVLTILRERELKRGGEA